MVTHSWDKKCFEKRNKNVARRAKIRADETSGTNNWHFWGLFLFCVLTFFLADIYMPWRQIYEKKGVLKKRMIKRKLRRHLDSAASRGPPWKASLQGKSLTVILAPTLSGISGYHLHLILFLLSWENIIQPVKRLAINCCWIIFQQMLRNQSSRSLNNLPDLILHHM